VGPTQEGGGTKSHAFVLCDGIKKLLPTLLLGMQVKEPVVNPGSAILKISDTQKGEKGGPSTLKANWLMGNISVC